MVTELSKPRRIELILRQIDSLPTLPAIATRLLSLTADEDSHAREVIQLVSADPSLTAKVLSLCRAADRGVRSDVLTVDRAVVLLGFNAVRNAVLSIKVYEFFEQTGATAPRSSTRATGRAAAVRRLAADSDDEQSLTRFDRSAFWTHSLAVAVVAELIAREHPGQRDLNPDEAFVCGLLHDIGKLALDHVLPKSFARVIELADLNQGNLAEFERRIVGIDHHTAGKRLAEQWQLPHVLQDCIWLHGSPLETLPALPHQRMVGLIALADLIARRQHLGYSGNHTFKDEEHVLARKLDLNPGCLDNVTARLHETLEQRAKSLGMNEAPSRELFLESIQRANVALGQLNHALDIRSRTAATQARILESVTAFHAQSVPGRSVQDVLDRVVESARNLLGAGFFTILYPGERTAHGLDTWLIAQYSTDGRALHSQYAEAPPHAPSLSDIDAQQPVGMNLMGILPWIADYLVSAEDLRQVRLLPLTCGWGTSALLLHDRPNLPTWNLLSAITSTWGAAIAAAAQHDGARRLGEQLAESNSALAEAQDRLLRTESLARLGEMAAGAAHEMNNPLAVISGRSQLLAQSLPPGSKEQRDAQTIARESHRLSDLITALHTFADPPAPQRRPVNLLSLLDATVKKFRSELTQRDVVAVDLQVKDQVPPVTVDPDQIQWAVRELLSNAVQANPRRGVTITVQLEPGDENVLIQVIDDGEGMDSHTLAHAMDPFFSDKPAGRRVGMGLPRTQQLAQAHGGRLDLRSLQGEGTTATLILPLDLPS